MALRSRVDLSPKTFFRNEVNDICMEFLFLSVIYIVVNPAKCRNVPLARIYACLQFGDTVKEGAERPIMQR